MTWKDKNTPRVFVGEFLIVPGLYHSRLTQNESERQNMTVWGHWTLCGLCPGSTHLLYEICSLFVCWKTLFALEYSVWGWAVSDGHVHTYLRNHKTHSLQAPSCRLSMEAQLQCLLGSLHSSECKMGYMWTPSTPDLLIISTVRYCYWCYGSPAVEQIVTWGLAVWICLKVSPGTWDISVGATCVSRHLES